MTGASRWTGQNALVFVASTATGSRDRITRERPQPHPRNLFRPASTKCFNVVDRFRGLRTVLIVRIDIRGADDALGVDDEPPRHRQGPTSFAVAYSKVISKTEIDLFEIIRERESKAKLRGIGVAGV
jgi:hypothetical protein